MENSARGWKFWALAYASVALFVLAVVNVFLEQENGDLQRQIGERQNYIAESAKLSDFNSKFVQTLANLAAQSNDRAISDLLTKNGITYTVKKTTPLVEEQTGE